LENTPYFDPAPWTPTPPVPDACPKTPYLVADPVLLSRPKTPFAPKVPDVFLPITAGVAVELEKLPSAARATTGIITMLNVSPITFMLRLVVMRLKRDLLVRFDGARVGENPAPCLPPPAISAGLMKERVARLKTTRWAKQTMSITSGGARLSAPEPSDQDDVQSRIGFLKPRTSEETRNCQIGCGLGVLISAS
jgi:hypothetical protein